MAWPRRYWSIQALPKYLFQSGATIDELQILTNEAGGRRAYLHACEGTSRDHLDRIIRALEAQQLKCVPIEHDGKPMLEVRGFKKPEAMLGSVRALGETLDGATPTITQQTPLEGDVRTREEKARNSTLRLAGISYNVGDFGYMFYAGGKYWIQKNGPNASKRGNFFNIVDIVAGIGYGIGSYALTFYGSRDQSLNIIQSTGDKIVRYAKQNGIAVDADASLQNVVREPERNFWQRLDHLFGKYPSETLNTIYVFVGGLLSLNSIYQSIEAHRSGNMKNFRTELLEIGLGTVTATSAIIGLAVKEKKPVEGEQRKKGLAGVWQLIEEKPLRATGIGYMIATLFHGGGTIRKYQAGDEVARKTILGRGLFVIANIVSEALLAVSSKGHGTGVRPDESVDRTVMATTADFIARQPTQKQEALIEQFAGYMATPEVLGGKAAEIAEQLRAQLAALKKNPWVRGSVVSQASVAAIATSSPQIATAHEAEAAPNPMAAHALMPQPATTVSHATRHEGAVHPSPALQPVAGG